MCLTELYLKRDPVSPERPVSDSLGCAAWSGKQRDLPRTTTAQQAQAEIDERRIEICVVFTAFTVVFFFSVGGVSCFRSIKCGMNPLAAGQKNRRNFSRQALSWGHHCVWKHQQHHRQKIKQLLYLQAAQTHHSAAQFFASRLFN